MMDKPYCAKAGKVLVLGKRCVLEKGIYTGDGVDNRYVDVGLPVSFMILRRMNSVDTEFVTSMDDAWMCEIVCSGAKNCNDRLMIVSNGFEVNNSYIANKENSMDVLYQYIAFCEVDD